MEGAPASSVKEVIGACRRGGRGIIIQILSKMYDLGGNSKLFFTAVAAVARHIFTALQKCK